MKTRRFGGGRFRLGRIGVVLVVAALVLIGSAPPVGAAPASVTITVGLDRGAIRADGVDAATLTVDAQLTSDGSPLAGATLKLVARWSTPASPGAAKLLPKPFVLDALGHGEASVTSLRSGTMTVTASIATTTLRGSATTSPLDATRHSIVVFASGASSIVTCPSPGVCADPLPILNPVRSQLSLQGFTAADMPTFSYKGGAIEPTTHEWIPAASTCEDSSVSYKTQVARMKSMLSKLGSTNPNSDISVVGISQGALLAFQMIDAAPKLPKGSRVAGVYALDGPIGGVPMEQVLQLQNILPTFCWSRNGTSPAAVQLENLWDTTSPTQGIDQADRTQTMCSYVLVATCPVRTNQAAVAAAVARGVVVQTWGSSQDGVFYPTACGTPGFWVDATSIQVVTGAGGGMHAEGLGGCAASHVVVINNRASEIAASIGAQQ
jgi:hypothetical protein